MWTFSCPTIIFGDGALHYLHQIKENKALVVTGKDVVASGLIHHVTERFQTTGMQCVIYDQVGEVPAVDAIDRGGRMAGELQPDWIIALGGQNCLSVARAIAGQVTAGQEASHWPSVADPGGCVRKTKLMAIHAQTGSSVDGTDRTEIDCGGAACDTDASGPDVAILAPEMFAQLSPQSVALVGMETLSKAIEGYVSPWGSSMTDGPALMAVRQVFTNLPSVFIEGEDVEARMQLQHAAFMADLCTCHASVGLAHGAAQALAHILGLFHRLAVSVLLPYAMEYMICNSIQTTTKYAEIGRFCGITNDASLQGASALVARVRACAAEIGQPLSLRECLPDKERYDASLDELIDRTLKQVAVLSTTRVPDRAGLADFFRCAYNGPFLDG